MSISSYINEKNLIIPISNNKKEGIKEIEIIILLPNIKKICWKKKLILHFKTNDNQLLSPSLFNIEQIINSKNVDERLNLIYDYVCDYLDNEIKNHNYCEFINGKCIFNRVNPNKYSTNGCCYHKSRGTCRFLVDSKCINKNVSCKFFMCSYLRKRGLKFNQNDIPQIKYFLNYRQREIIYSSFFKSKEEIINNLILMSKKRSILVFLIKAKKY